MKKELKDYLHLYLGCEIEYGAEDDRLVGTMTNVDNFSTYTVNVGMVMVPIQQVKLILRPLSDMRQGEQAVVDEIYEDMRQVSGDITTPEKIYFEIEVHASITKYLLSRHFDLFGLIESGLALDNTKHTA
jgi:hypothetical protein